MSLSTLLVANRDFLVATLRTREFLAGDTTTDFIERVAPARVASPGEAELVLTSQLAALWIQGANRAEARTLAAAPSGWRNARMPEQRVVLVCRDREIEERYRALRGGRFRFGDGAEARIHAWSPDAIDAEVDGRRVRARVARAGDLLVVQGVRGALEFTLKPRFELPGAAATSGGFLAPMPGKVIDLRVRAGTRVRKGETLVVLEAMKMEHPMRATADGVVTEVCVVQGEQVKSGTVLLVFEPDVGSGEAK